MKSFSVVEDILDILESPSMRREWIEITASAVGMYRREVSLHAEGVD